jgi:hypothetical protein
MSSAEAFVAVGPLPLGAPTEVGDGAAREAQRVFWQTLKLARPDSLVDGEESAAAMWPDEEKDEAADAADDTDW